MRTLIKRILGDRLNIDWKIAVITIVSTLLIIVEYYYSPTSRNYLDSILLFVIIPLGITIFVFKEKPADYGFKLGDWKTGLLFENCSCEGSEADSSDAKPLVAISANAHAQFRENTTAFF